SLTSLNSKLVVAGKSSSSSRHLSRRSIVTNIKPQHSAALAQPGNNFSKTHRGLIQTIRLTRCNQAHQTNLRCPPIQKTLPLVVRTSEQPLPAWATLKPCQRD